MTKRFKGLMAATFTPMHPDGEINLEPIYLRVIDAVERGDLEEARLWQGRALEVITNLFGTCGRAGLKSMMKMVGMDCGSQRLPIANATSEQVDNLKAGLDKMGFYEWIKV